MIFPGSTRKISVRDRALYMTSPGDGSLVGRGFTQSLGARLLVLVLRAVGTIFNLFYICFTLDNQMVV